MSRTYRSRFRTRLYLLGTMLIVAVIALIILFSVYNKRLEEARKITLSQAEEFTNLFTANEKMDNESVEQASTDLNKTISQAIADMQMEEQNDNEEETVISKTQEEITEPVEVIEEKKELCFESPVEGEITKDFARETLIFSETLQEWTVHNGIDIKADRTTVVKAAEEGIVSAINNDPRYGLTVIIEHSDGFKTIYSNLLTSEFVQVGEVVQKGQSIGTVGNSAPFEIADQAHLHFEMMINNEYVDPTMYLQ